MHRLLIQLFAIWLPVVLAAQYVDVKPFGGYVEATLVYCAIGLIATAAFYYLLFKDMFKDKKLEELSRRQEDLQKRYEEERRKNEEERRKNEEFQKRTIALLGRLAAERGRAG